MLTYALVTAARNEAALIGRVIDAVTRQTILPVKWIIVSDGSTDGTAAIVSSAATAHPWIELVSTTDRGNRDFASKVYAFTEGWQRLRNCPHDIIANLDADITFDADYMEYLLAQFEHDPGLGVAGTPFLENGQPVYDYRFTNIEHVSGGCQIFRRECFEQIGGFRPIKAGGEDWTAVTTARMRGWRTRTFTDKQFHHHRPMGSAQGSRMMLRLRAGGNDYRFGNHPLWECCRALYQCRKRPYILGGLMLLSGYFIAAASGTPRPIPDELVAFCRREQLARLRGTWHRWTHRTQHPDARYNPQP